MRKLIRQPLLPLALLCAFASSAEAAVFVNELHYDDSTPAGDTGERIEVVATAGESLADYSIVLYNGANTYDTDAVPAGSVVSCVGNVSVAVLSYPTNGIQNGGSDGIALVRTANSQVIQFLSYEGQVTAGNGPASGLTSVDIGVAETNSTAPGTSLQLAGDGNVASAFTWQGSANATFGACNNGQTFTAGVDVVPTVATTVPANDATTVAINANVTVAFSEPVSLGTEWISASCAVSGPRATSAFAITGGPGSYTINPVADFANDELCTFTVTGAAVLDQDGTPNPMASDYTWSFRTIPVPVDVAPTVSSTVPTDGASNVAPNAPIRVDFSEPVTLGTSAFALACESVPLAITVTDLGTGEAYRIDPTGMGPVEDCVLTITASLVVDRDGAPDAMAADFALDFTTRAAGSAYYASVDASSCVALRTTLHALIDDHQFFPYTSSATDTWDILNTADQDPAATGNILDIYKNASYTKISGGTGVYNREHTWPNSYGYNDRTGDEAYTDTHMLYASDSQYNFNRSNIPYDDCPAMLGCTSLATDANGGRGGGSGSTYPGNNNWYSNSRDSFQVWSGRKGDAARAVLYMDIRYEGGTNVRGRPEPDLIVTEDRALIQGTASGVFVTTGYMGVKSTLLAWHAADPPDTDEGLRNDVVQTFQGNRNPFIDHPEWVAIAFQSPCTGTAPTNTAPVFADATLTVLENAAANTTVATLAATDANAGQVLTYSIASGNETGAFALEAATGRLSVANPALIDGAVAAVYTLVVRATDDGTPALSDDATITIGVTPVNDAPSFTKGADVTVARDSGAATLAGWATAIVAGPVDEAAQALTFEITANTNAALFAVTPAIAANGTLSFTPAAGASGVATISARLVDDGGGTNASPIVTFAITVEAGPQPDALFANSFE